MWNEGEETIGIHIMELLREKDDDERIDTAR